MATLPIRSSLTHHCSVEEVTARLARRSEVDGVVMMGSGGTGGLSPSSDIDLLVVLADGLLQARMLSTTIAERLAEVYFVQCGELDAWVKERPALAQDSFAAVRLGWIESGMILFDRVGRLVRLQAALKSAGWVKSPDPGEIYTAWFRTNYDLAQTGRLVTAEDSASRIKADLRLLRMLAEVWERYFLARRLPALSDKGRIRWMQTNDPDFLVDFQACLAEADRAAKFERWTRLARRALEPAGELWPDAATAIELAQGGAEQAAALLDVWQDWLRAD
jgi:hypothetical protein